MSSRGSSFSEVAAVAELYMTSEEIVRSYQQAEDKDEQINILSQLNGCRRKTILRVLEQQGVRSGENSVSTKRGGKHCTMAERDGMFQPLYDQGLNDCQIATECEVSTTTVLRWRVARNLPSNREPGWNGKLRDHVSTQISA